MTKKIRTIKNKSKIKVKLDSLYQSFWYSKFSNKFMLQGKKHVIEKILYLTFFKIKMHLKRSPLTLMFILLMRIKPLLGKIPKRLGTEWKTVPTPLNPKEQLIIALKWLVLQIKTEGEKNFANRVYKVFVKFFDSRRNSLIRHRNIHRFDLIKDRINLRYRWR